MPMVTAPELHKVLLVEDDEDDYLITRDMLADQQRARFDLEWSPTFDGALAAIRERRHDVYLIDYRLGEHTGLELVRECFVRGPQAPVILLTGHRDDEVDLEATSLGVTDFVIKQGLDAAGLERSIRYAISHHKALGDLARSEERYALAVSAANDGIWDWDLTTGRIYVSPRWQALLGRQESADHVSPDAWFALVHDEDLPILTAAIDAHLVGTTGHLEVEHRMLHSDGRWRWVLNRGRASRDPRGVATRMAGSMSDVTERRAAERRLQHHALHDHLTGLPNRALFMDRLNQVVERSAREPDVGCAVLFVDIDRFKLINDSLSHAVGDQLLVALASRLADAVRQGDTVARLGGDEFTLLLDGVTSETEATIAAERVQSALADPVDVAGHELSISASIGIALSSRGISAAELLRNADIAMYDAKRSDGAYAVFDESMHRRVVDRASRENELRRAVGQSLIDVHYQPIIDLKTGQIRAMEALARWPAGWPVVAPLEFITIAEECGLIKDLGLHVLRTALGALAGWRRSGLVSDELCISVNVSSRQLNDPALAEQILAAIAGAGVPAGALRLEVTETSLMEQRERTRGVVAELCARGVGLHLDDFGTGYSSLAALHRFPFDAVKIDRSFVTGQIGHANGNDTIVRSTVALAHGLGLQVIAEGIEHFCELRHLRELGCEYGQGFLFSRPLNAKDAQAFLGTWSPADAAAGWDRVAGRDGRTTRNGRG